MVASSDDFFHLLSLIVLSCSELRVLTMSSPRFFFYLSFRQRPYYAITAASLSQRIQHSLIAIHLRMRSAAGALSYIRFRLIRTCTKSSATGAETV